VSGCSSGPGPEKKEEPIAPVKVVPVKDETLAERTELLGTTLPLPNRIARVGSPLGGQVLKVLVGPGSDVAEGDWVKAGQPLVQLDDRIAKANRDKAASALTDLGEQEKQAEYAVELAAIEVKRLEDLGKEPAGGGVPLVSKVDLDKARVARKDAQSKLDAVAARQASARAELRALNAQLDYYTLKAPIAGRLGLIQAEAGQTLAPGSTVAEVINLDEIDVLCHVPPRAAQLLDSKQEAWIAGTKKPVGHVVYVAEQAQAETGNFEVKVRFPNKEAKLRANAVARVEVLTRRKEKCLALKEKALMEDQDPPGVVVVLKSDLKTEKKGEEEETFGEAHKLQAKLGLRDREQQLVEIVSLEGADKKKISPHDVLFVVEGGHGLEDGDKVKIEK
jgi:RND family efflux transporter MFP subunit